MRKLIIAATFLALIFGCAVEPPDPDAINVRNYMVVAIADSCGHSGGTILMKRSDVFDILTGKKDAPISKRCNRK